MIYLLNSLFLFAYEYSLFKQFFFLLCLIFDIDKEFLTRHNINQRFYAQNAQNIVPFSNFKTTTTPKRISL